MANSKAPYGVNVPKPTNIKGGASSTITPSSGFEGKGPAAGSTKKSDSRK